MKGFKKLSSFVLCAALFAALAAGGCGGSSEDSAAVSSKAVMHGDVPEVIVKAIEKDPEVPVTHLFGKNYICSVEMGSEEQKTYAEAYKNHSHFVFFEPTEEEVAHFLKLIDQEGSSISYAKKFSNSEILGIENEKDGDTHIFSHNNDNGEVSDETLRGESSEADDSDPRDFMEPTPEESTPEQIPDVKETEDEVTNLLAWLKSGENPDYQPTEEFNQAVDAALRGGVEIPKDPDNDKINNFAHRYLVTKSGSLFKKNGKHHMGYNKVMTVNCYIAAIHKFNEGTNFYFIDQECQLDGSSGYRKDWARTYHWPAGQDGTKYYVGQGEFIDGYIKSYTITNTISGDVKEAILIGAEPQAEDKKHEVTYSKTWGVSGTLGFNGNLSKSATTDPKTTSNTNTKSGGASLSVTGEYRNNKTETFVTKDVETIKQINTGENGSSVAWKHNFREPKWRRGQYLDEGAELGHSTYKPKHSWLWGGEGLNGVKEFNVVVTGEVGSLMTHNSGSKCPRYRYKTVSTKPMTVPFPDVPRFAIRPHVYKDGKNYDYNFEYDKTQKVHHIEVNSDYKWEIVDGKGNKYVDEDGNTTMKYGDWATIKNKNGSSLITVSLKENTTGEDREMSFIVRVTDEKERDGNTNLQKIFVTQYAGEIEE